MSDDEILKHLRERRPILDVRAPIEFEQGSVPHSSNIPLLEDVERAEVGTVYKNEGPDAALARGYKLVSQEIAALRVQKWTAFVKQNPTAAVMCFRGGLRSQLVQKTLGQNGINIPLVEGGFKRVRRLLFEQLNQACDTRSFKVLSGYTGTGKTRILRASRLPFIDLESAAKHRGSSFGNWTEPQPSVVRFENELGIESHRLLQVPDKTIWLEDESRSIGKLVLPKKLFEALSSAQVWVLEKSRDERAASLTSEYLSENYGLQDGLLPQPEIAARVRQDIGRAVLKIERRLGGAETKKVLEMTIASSDEFDRSGRFSAHWPWVERILETYYDPLYEKHLGLISDRVIGRGPEDGFRAFAKG